MNTKYLSKRPFLVIDTYHQPAPGVKTHRKGWAEIARNWQRVEHPMLVTRVSAAMLARATVVIDIVNNTLVKNRFSDSPAEEVLAHYSGKFAEHMDHGRTHYAVMQAAA